MLDIINEGGLWGLLFGSFFGSTLLPGGSEVLLVLLASNGEHSKLALLGVATLGNTLGGMSSWLIGRVIAWRYPTTQAITSESRQRAIQRMQKWGAPLLLLSWLPIVGDPLCVAAGWLRIHGGLALLFIAAGKAARYAVILLFA